MNAAVKRTAIAAALAIMVGGCATMIDQHSAPPADRPLLKRVTVETSWWEMTKTCYPYMGLLWKLLGGLPEACAVIDFRTMTCTKYLVEGGHESIAKHEEDHCDLRDHYNSSVLADYWKDWKAKMTAGDATYYYVRHDGLVVKAAP